MKFYQSPLFYRIDEFSTFVWFHIFGQLFSLHSYLVESSQIWPKINLIQFYSISIISTPNSWFQFPIENFASKLASELTTAHTIIIQELFKEELSIKNFLKSFSPINTIKYILCITFFIDFPHNWDLMIFDSFFMTVGSGRGSCSRGPEIATRTGNGGTWTWTSSWGGWRLSSWR